MRPFRITARAFAWATVIAAAGIGCGGGGSDASRSARAEGSVPPEGGQAASASASMRKQVSERASFVLYTPEGWKVVETSDGRGCAVAATDGSGALRVSMAIGAAGGDAVEAARSRLAPLLGNPEDLAIHAARVSSARDRLVADGAYTDRFGVRRQFRSWVVVRSGEASLSVIEAPEGALDARRQALLTVLANVRVMKGVFAADPGEAAAASLETYRMRDGSASFGMPAGWQCKELGAGSFLAGDDAGHIFMSGGVDLVTPRLGINPPGVLVSPVLPPSRAWEFITGRLGLASDMRFESVNPRPDLSGPTGPGGGIQSEDFTYTCTSREGRRLKGYTFGMTTGGGAGLNWSFRHISVFAPAESFDAYVPTFVAMLASYRIDDAYARNYVQQGMARLRQMQRETAALIARNADEIHSMMQAAYDERQRSEEYIDYQRTNTIRGQSDWISEMEGGAVYHTDSWGTKNTATGEYFEGAPYDYVHFEGKNPKYDEQMQPIDNRELYEKYRP